MFLCVNRGIPSILLYKKNQRKDTMKTDLAILVLVGLVAVVGLIVSQGAITGRYITSPSPEYGIYASYPQNAVKRAGDYCGPHDACGQGYSCVQGVCTYSPEHIEILPGQMCVPNIPCKFGFQCIEGRCQRA